MVSGGLAAHSTVSFMDDQLGEGYYESKYGYPVGWQLTAQVSYMDDRLVGRYRWVVVFGVEWGRCRGDVHSHTTYLTFSDLRVWQLFATATMAASVMLW